MLALLWLLQRRIARKGVRRRDTDAVQILSRQGVGGKAHVVVARIEGTRYVLGVTEHGITVLDRLTADAGTIADAAPQRDAAGTFESILASTRPEPEAAPVRLRVRHRSDALRGSVFSPDTWRQTGEALRRVR